MFGHPSRNAVILTLQKFPFKFIKIDFIYTHFFGTFYLHVCRLQLASWKRKFTLRYSGNSSWMDSLSFK
ncbi:hypothetical protein CT690_14750 [Serratia plymuthica]|uniref:Uncharacterized protein n=1 Tax=Serratia plymuthica TaxID=82996 RepID=A0A318P0T9_SERPL|nr:hypothetical protein CT690_14750 [Serratia plymuthica]